MRKGASCESWDAAILNAFRERLAHDKVAGYKARTITLDSEYLDCFDHMLIELPGHDNKLQHLPSPEQELLRSAAIEIVIQAYLDSRKRAAHASPKSAHTGGALSGDMASHIFSGLTQRMSPAGRGRLTTMNCLLTTDLALGLDDELTSALREESKPGDHTYWTDGDVDDLRSAVIEAGMLTWVIWRLAPDGAMPSRRAHINARLRPRRPHRSPPWRRRP